MITENEFLLRKQRMILSAYTLFCENGIDATSMVQIAKKAGVSEISLYRYFGNKITLLSQTQNILWGNVLKEIEISLFEKNDYHSLTGLEQTKMNLNAFYSLVDNHRDYLLFVASYKDAMITNKTKLNKDEIITIFKKPIANFKAAINKGQADGSIKNKTDAAILAETIWNIMRGYAEQIAVYDALEKGDSNSYRDNFENLLSIIYTALLAE